MEINIYLFNQKRKVMFSVFTDRLPLPNRTKTIKKKMGVRGWEMGIIKRNSALERKIFRLLTRSQTGC